MTVDLEEEQDPPSFKAARKKDKERLQKVSSCLYDYPNSPFAISVNGRRGRQYYWTPEWYRKTTEQGQFIEKKDEEL